MAGGLQTCLGVVTGQLVWPHLRTLQSLGTTLATGLPFNTSINISGLLSPVSSRFINHFLVWVIFVTVAECNARASCVARPLH